MHHRSDLIHAQDPRWLSAAIHTVVDITSPAYLSTVTSSLPHLFSMFQPQQPPSCSRTNQEYLGMPSSVPARLPSPSLSLTVDCFHNSGLGSNHFLEGSSLTILSRVTPLMSAIYCLCSNHSYISDFMYFPVYFPCLLLQQKLSDNRAVLLSIDVSPACKTVQVPSGCLIIDIYEGLP